jgi:phage-related protein
VREAERSMGRLGSVGSKMGTVLKGAAVAGAAALAAGVVKVGVDAAKAASDLQQSIGAVESTFSGKALATIRDFGSTAATSVGLAESQFNQLAAVSGSMLQNLGYNAQDAAKATVDLTTRAADLAATFNTDTSSAMDAINAALRGEMDPLEQFGIKLSAADLKAKAMAMGLDMSTDAAKKHSTAQAALALIMEQSASKAGAFTDEATSMAGGMQILGAQWQDILAKIGQAFMPLIQQVIAFISANVVPALQTFAEWMSNLGAAFQSGGEAAGPLQGIMDALRNTFDTVWPAVQKVGEFLINMGKAIYEGVQPIIEAVVSFIRDTFLPVFNSIWQTIQSKLLPAWNQFVEAMRPVLRVVGNIVASLKGPLSVAFRVVGAAIRVVITIIGTIISIISKLINAITTVARAVGGVFAGAWRAAGSAIQGIIGIVQNVIGVIQRAISAVRNFFSSGIGKIGSAIGGLFGRSATGRSATGRAAGRAPAGRAPGTIVVQGATNPQYLARDLSRIITGANVRTGFTGVRI